MRPLTVGWVSIFNTAFRNDDGEFFPLGLCSMNFSARLETGLQSETAAVKSKQAVITHALGAEAAASCLSPHSPALGR